MKNSASKSQAPSKLTCHLKVLGFGEEFRQPVYSVQLRVLIPWIRGTPPLAKRA